MGPTAGRPSQARARIVMAAVVGLAAAALVGCSAPRSGLRAAPPAVPVAMAAADALPYPSQAYARYAAAAALDAEAQRLEELFTYQRLSRGTRQPSLIRDSRALRRYALDALDEALEYDPSSPAILRRKGDILLELGGLDEAIALYRRAEAAGVGDPRWYFQVAGQLEMAGKPLEAAEMLERVSDAAAGGAPGELSQIALLKLGDLYSRLDRLADAERVYRKALASRRFEAGAASTRIGAALASKLEEDPTGVRRLLISVLVKAGKYDEALEQALEAAGQAPRDPRVLSALVGVYHARGEFERAVGAAEEFVAANPDSQIAVLALMESLSAAGRVDDAVARARAYLAGHDDDAKVRQEVVKIYKEAGRAEEAVAFVMPEAASGELPSYPVALSLLDMYVSGKASASAFQLAERMLQSNTMDLSVALQVLGLLWSGLPEPECEAFCSRYVRTYADDVRASYAYAQILKSKGDNEKAAEVMVSVAEAGAHFGDAYEIAARHLAGKGETYRAVTVFLSGVDKGFVAHPEAFVPEAADGARDPIALAAQLEADLPKYDSARQTLYEIIGGLYLDGADFARAESYYRKALEAPAPLLMDYAALAISLYRQQKTADAIALVDGLIRKGQGAPPIVRMLVSMLSQDGAYGEAVRLAEKLISEQPTDIDNHMTLASVYVGAEDYAAAEKELLVARDLAEGDPAALLRVRYMLGVVCDEEGRDDEAVALWRANLAAAPDDANTLNALGYHYADRGTNLEEALTMIEKAVGAEPDNGAYLDSLGWVYYKMGNIPLAVDNLKKAADKERDAVIYDHLGDALFKAGDGQGALDAWLSSLGAKPREKDRLKVQEKIKTNFPQYDLSKVK